MAKEKEAQLIILGRGGWAPAEPTGPDQADCNHYRLQAYHEDGYGVIGCPICDEWTVVYAEDGYPVEHEHKTDVGVPLHRALGLAEQYGDDDPQPIPANEEHDPDVSPWASALVNTYDLDGAVVVTLSGNNIRFQGYGKDAESDETMSALARALMEVIVERCEQTGTSVECHRKGDDDESHS